jgi:hypothetical protein
MSKQSTVDKEIAAFSKKRKLIVDAFAKVESKKAAPAKPLYTLTAAKNQLSEDQIATLVKQFASAGYTLAPVIYKQTSMSSSIDNPRITRVG